MASRQVTVRYEDGSSVTVELKPKHLIAAERLINKALDQHGVEATFMAAWKATRSPARFDDWLDTVDDLTEHVVEEDGGLDPTDPPPAEPSPAE